MGMILFTIGACIIILIGICTLGYGVYVAWEQSPFMGIVVGAIFLGALTAISGLLLMNFSGA
jgi:hypothetical protein